MLHPKSYKTTLNHLLSLYSQKYANKIRPEEFFKNIQLSQFIVKSFKNHRIFEIVTEGCQIWPNFRHSLKSSKFLSKIIKIVDSNQVVLNCSLFIYVY